MSKWRIIKISSDVIGNFDVRTIYDFKTSIYSLRLEICSFSWVAFNNNWKFDINTKSAHRSWLIYINGIQLAFIVFSQMNCGIMSQFFSSWPRLVLCILFLFFRNTVPIKHFVVCFWFSSIFFFIPMKFPLDSIYKFISMVVFNFNNTKNTLQIILDTHSHFDVVIFVEIERNTIWSVRLVCVSFNIQINLIHSHQNVWYYYAAVIVNMTDEINESISHIFASFQ